MKLHGDKHAQLKQQLGDVIMENDGKNGKKWQEPRQKKQNKTAK